MTEPGRSGRLSLAFRDLEELHPRIVEKFANRVSDLDLSNNNLSNIDPLKAFTKLETLVLDNNKISSHTKFPHLPKLSTLWVNHNCITNLSVFIDKLVDSVPNLKYLSMLGNEACPNFLNGGSLKQYNDYRQYTINRLRNLTQLDSAPITEEERRKAMKVYGNLPTSIAKEEEEREREREEEEKKEQERILKEKEESERRKAERRKLQQRKKELIRKKREQELEKQKAASAAAEQTAVSVQQPQQQVSAPISSLPTSSTSILDILPDVNEKLSLDDPVFLPSVTAPAPFLVLDTDNLTDDDDWSDDDDDDGWE